MRMPIKLVALSAVCLLASCAVAPERVTGEYSEMRMPPPPPAAVTVSSSGQALVMNPNAPTNQPPSFENMY